MCGRFNVISDPLTRLLLELTGSVVQLRTCYNIAPTEQVPVLLSIDGARDVRSMRWWLVPSWSDRPSTKYSMFNARADNLLKSRAFRGPLERQRCVVLASGYYEWQREEDRKLPWYITPEVGDGLLFAGLWDRWQSENEVVESCTVITTDAHPSLRNLHHRMPVMLTTLQVEQWLAPVDDVRSLQRLFVPRLPSSLELRPVSSYVNNSRNKTDECLKAVARSQIIDSERKFDSS